MNQRIQLQHGEEQSHRLADEEGLSGSLQGEDSELEDQPSDLNLLELECDGGEDQITREAEEEQRCREEELREGQHGLA